MGLWLNCCCGLWAVKSCKDHSAMSIIQGIISCFCWCYGLGHSTCDPPQVFIKQLYYFKPWILQGFKWWWWYCTFCEEELQKTQVLHWVEIMFLSVLWHAGVYASQPGCSLANRLVKAKGVVWTLHVCPRPAASCSIKHACQMLLTSKSMYSVYNFLLHS